jgi:hypothetical protein
MQAQLAYNHAKKKPRPRRLGSGRGWLVDHQQLCRL